ncbi:MAG: reverse transcriptase-like protein [Candidatus Dadabacteria bacterium]|nr:MAG: reverse transcriptase-like protein [Candidatus Dadabacteria bacterium]
MTGELPVELFTDGASRGNPGQAAIGAWARRGDEILFEISRAIGKKTNNEAEYLALLAGLERLLARGATDAPVRVYMDSQLIVRQLSGQYKVKSAGLRPLWEKARALVAEFPDIVVEHVPRAQNQRADALANQALDQL